MVEMKLHAIIVIVLWLLHYGLIHVNAQIESSPILFIYDASGSMWGQMEGRTKKEIAAEVLSTAVRNLPDKQKVGLMAYGHREKADCSDVELLVDLDNTSKDKVIEAVLDINPLGRTPLARSATVALNSLRKSNTKATIILITDGIESCDGKICEVVSAAKIEGINFKLHIVGFGLKESDVEKLKCAAAAGSGQYYDAPDAGGLGEMLNEATAETVDDPPGNFSFCAIKNGEPVDAWVKVYKAGTKEEAGTGRTYRDSAFLYLLPGKYDVDVKPLENTDISATMINIEVIAGRLGHQTISFDGAYVSVTTTNNNEGWDALVKLYNSATGKVLATTRTYGRTKTMEVNPGTYDITFGALKIKGMEGAFKIEDVEIKAGDKLFYSHNFESGIAMIGVRTTRGELIDATVNFKRIESGKNVSGGRTYTSDNSNPKKFILNVGTYSVIIKTLGKHKGHSETFNITVKAGETIEKTFAY
jgi:Ca-activated chloride channel homolog